MLLALLEHLTFPLQFKGNGGVDSDSDNVYLYANDLIQVNGLSFSGSRLDDVYMEAITVNLNNVSFPSTADVIPKAVMARCILTHIHHPR